MKTIPEYKAVIFDLDGTLLDTLFDIGDAVNRVLQSLGFPIHEINAYRQFIGDGSELLVTRALPEGQRTREMVSRCLHAFKQDYGVNFNNRTAPYSGIPELLDYFVHQKMDMAVLTNKPHALAEKSTLLLLSRWKFKIIMGQQSDLPLKPDPAGALQIAAAFQIHPSQFLFIGDSAVDMKTAVAAGMLPVGACWGFRTAAELEKGGARLLAHHPSEVIAYLKKNTQCGL